jgi:hypothetical protein
MNCMQYLHEGSANMLPVYHQRGALSRKSLISHLDGKANVYRSYDTCDNLQALPQTYGGADNTVTFSYTWWENHQRNSTAVNNLAFQYLPPTGTTSYGTLRRE